MNKNNQTVISHSLKTPAPPAPATPLLQPQHLWCVTGHQLRLALHPINAIWGQASHGGELQVLQLCVSAVKKIGLHAYAHTHTYGLLGIKLKGGVYLRLSVACPAKFKTWVCNFSFNNVSAVTLAAAWDSQPLQNRAFAHLKLPPCKCFWLNRLGSDFQ